MQGHCTEKGGGVKESEAEETELELPLRAFVNKRHLLSVIGLSRLADTFDNETLSDWVRVAALRRICRNHLLERMSRAHTTRYFAFCPLIVLVLCAPFVTCTRNPSAPCNHTSASK